MTIRELEQYRSLLREIENDRARMSTVKKHGEGSIKICENLQKNKVRCIAVLDDILSFVDRIEDSNVRDIVKLRFIDGYTWPQVATKRGLLGDGSTERKRVLRYLEKGM